VKLADQVEVTEERLREALFGKELRAEVLLATDTNTVKGFAVFFPTYSTFLGRPGIYLEDLFVSPEWRSLGIGTALLAAVARKALERGCSRLEWSAVDWNKPAVGFYESLGAQPQSESTIFRLSGEPLQRLGSVGAP
jgi:GNAT superfamily N-acetyltransferase